jgi:hypothetical protein
VKRKYVVDPDTGKITLSPAATIKGLEFVKNCDAGHALLASLSLKSWMIRFFDKLARDHDKTDAVCMSKITLKTSFVLVFDVSAGVNPLSTWPGLHLTSQRRNLRFESFRNSEFADCFQPKKVQGQGLVYQGSRHAASSRHSLAAHPSNSNAPPASQSVQRVDIGFADLVGQAVCRDRLASNLKTRAG